MHLDKFESKNLTNEFKLSQNWKTNDKLGNAPNQSCAASVAVRSLQRVTVSDAITLNPCALRRFPCPPPNFGEVFDVQVSVSFYSTPVRCSQCQISLQWFRLRHGLVHPYLCYKQVPDVPITSSSPPHQQSPPLLPTTGVTSAAAAVNASEGDAQKRSP